MSLSELASIWAKAIFRIHALTATAAISRKLSRTKVRTFFARLAPCRVGMEACGSAHYWARELAAMGHEVVLMAPAYIKPYVKRGKNDALDAAAICEAMSRPDMRFVPVKSADQQAVLMLHKTRELLVKQRTMSVNALRGHLAEFGLVVAKGISRVGELLELAERDGALPQEAREMAKLLACLIEAGNPADSERFLPMLERHIAFYGEALDKQPPMVVSQAVTTSARRRPSASATWRSTRRPACASWTWSKATGSIASYATSEPASNQTSRV